MSSQTQTENNYFREILFITFAQKRLIVKTALFIFVCIVAYTLLTPPKYTAQTTLLIKGKQVVRNPEAFNQVAERKLAITREDLNSEVQMLTSIHVLKSTIQELSKELHLLDSSSEEDLQKAIRKLNKAVTVAIVPASNVINISVDWSSANDAKRIVEGLLDNYYLYRTSVYQPERLRTFYDDTVSNYQDAIDKKQLEVGKIFDSMKSTSSLQEIESNLSLRKEYQAQLVSHEQSRLTLQASLTFLTKQLAQAQSDGTTVTFIPAVIPTTKNISVKQKQHKNPKETENQPKHTLQPIQQELMAIDNKHFTLQLFMARTMDAANRYLKSNNLSNNSKVKIYRTERSGELRFVVIYGNFKNSQIAKNTHESGDFSKSTWVKPYTLVHKDIKRLISRADDIVIVKSDETPKVLDRTVQIQKKQQASNSDKLFLFTSIDNLAIRQLADSVQQAQHKFNLTSKNFLPNTTKYKLSKKQLDKQYNTLLLEVTSLKDHRRTELASLEQIISYLTNKIELLNQRNLELSQLQVSLNSLNRDLALLEQSFSNYYKLREEATMMDKTHSASLSTQIVILTPPWANAKATSPNKRLLIPFGLVIAILVGLTVGFINEYFDDSFKRSDDSQRFLGMPALLSFNDLEHMNKAPAKTKLFSLKMLSRWTLFKDKK